MSISNVQEITHIWDDFANAGYVYLSHDGEQNTLKDTRLDRDERLPVRRKLLQKFLKGDLELETFKSEMASEAQTHSLWAFSSPIGGLFFNLLVDAPQPEADSDLTPLLQEVLAEPADESAAKKQIIRLKERVEKIRERSDDLQSAPSAGSIPYFVSYFWQLQAPDTYPIYYPSMRDAFTELEIWEPSDDIEEDYLEFWNVNEEIRSVLEEHTGEDVHLWTIERLFLFWLNRDEIEPKRETDGQSEIWQVAPDSSDELWKAWADNDVMSIGWSSLGDCEGLSRKEIANGLGVETSSNNVTTIDYFANSISPGDVVVARKGRSSFYGIGVVKSEYDHDPEKASEIFTSEYTSYHNLIGVKWVLDFVEEFGEPLKKPEELPKLAVPTVRQYSHYEELKDQLLADSPALSQGFDRIESLRRELSIRGGSPSEVPKPKKKDQTVEIDVSADLSVSLDPEMIDGLHFPDTMGTSLSDLLQEVEAALNAGNHVMFTGPPGTGKTELAEQVANYLAAERSDLFTGAHLTTATADWSTFETIGGYMPAKNGEGELKFQPGQLLRRFKREDSQRNDITVVDEINRADIDKAFGQLFTVLSGQTVYLPYETETGREILIRSAANSGQSTDADEAGMDGDEVGAELSEDEFVIPRSWRLMATMNSYDKTSLYDMSFAFMRRFTFIRVGAPRVPEQTEENPSPEEFIRGYLKQWDAIDLEPGDPAVKGILAAWRIMNTNEDARSLGPAIVKDMLSFISGLDYSTKGKRDRAVAKAVTAYVFPQLEGMIDKRRDPVLDDLKKSDHIDTDLIDEAASEQFR